ncbi:hypothetical protein Taro_054777 [Colocasia esculenta]|uniref:RING-type domain-containing protein n=1 Tax=Colocasia esculenta TaxID=4460 RepID=A0A843XRH7_COLES|nr:hypothetical protein [Colocasia esculenta]
MASAPEREAVEERRGRLLEFLRGSVPGPDGDPLVFFPILVGIMGLSRDGEGDASSVADRIVLVNPLTQEMVVLRSGGGGSGLTGLMQGMLAMEGGALGPPPASKASMEAMRAVERPTGEGKGEEEVKCVVCLDELWAASEGESIVGVVKEMPCRHRFHGDCIEKWLGMHGSCPVCRYRMPEEKQQERKEEEEVGFG